MSDVLTFISFWLSATWDFFTEINVPGFDFSFASFFIGVFLIYLGIRLFFSMFSIGAAAFVFKTGKGNDDK